MNSQEEIQSGLFAFLYNRFGKERVFKESKELLHLQRGALYKRINGETAMTVEELSKLTKHFNVSLDSALNQSSFFSFSHPFLELSQSAEFLDVFEFYLKPMIFQESKELIYLANEIPVFYYLAHSEIFHFQTALWEYKKGGQKKLSIQRNRKENKKLADLNTSVQAYYNSNPVTEIWNSSMLSNLYQQIIFSISIRAFEDPNMIQDILSDISQLIEGLKETVEGNEAVNHQIYLNDFGNYLNMVLYNAQDLKASFIGMDIPQFMVSHDKFFYQFALQWITDIRKRSVLISSGGYQNKELFFVRLDKDFVSFKNNVQKLVSLYY